MSDDRPAAEDQFERDVRGDHDGPLSYAWLTRPETTEEED